MYDIGAAPRAAVLSPARAEASRRNGAKSCGPKTPEGKTRSSRNALRHGLRAQKHVVLPGEGAAAFEAFETAMLEEMAPEGALQTVLARRVVAAAWRLERAERIEDELFAWNGLGGGRGCGLALIRDCNGARAFGMLLRYRGGTLAEFSRALRTLKALQAERREQEAREAAPTQQPDEPERRRNPGDSGRPAAPTDATGNSALAWLPSWPFRRPAPQPGAATPAAPAPCVRPIGPEASGKPTELPPQSLRAGIGQGSGALLTGTALSSAVAAGPEFAGSMLSHEPSGAIRRRGPAR